MATIVLTTHGSSGDLNPFLALGQGLQARGHEVRFALSNPLVSLAEAAGFTVHRLADDAPLTEKGAVYAGGSSVGSLKAAVQQTILPTLEQKVEDLQAACRDADLLVAASLQLPAPIVADLIGIPWASVAVAPLALPSADFPPSPMPPAPAPLRPLMNRIAWSVGARLLDPIADPAVNALRARYGLPPRRHLLIDGGLSDELVAVAVSPAFLPRPMDWPDQARVTGFCFWDGPGDWVAPPGLETFLADPRPVIAVSSGSQSPGLGDAFAAFYRTTVAGIREAGARVLVVGAALGALPDPLPEDVLSLPFAPFAAIYPRCAAVIHHGGIGTTAQALRAGVPMLVAPWGFDQFFIADRVGQLGAGLQLNRQRDTSSKIAEKIAALLNQSLYRARAQALASQIAREDGVGTLCNALNNVLAHSRLQARL